MRSALVGVISLFALAIAAPGAAAAVSSSFDGGSKTLTVTSDAGSDTIAVTCPVANLLVNGANPSSGALPCFGVGAPSALVLVGNGGADTLDVSALEGLTLNTVSLDGGEGDDDLRGVYLASTTQVVSLLAGAGNDLLSPNSSDAARGGAGDDRIDGPVQEGGSLDGEAGNDTFALTLPSASPVSFAFAPSSAGLSISAPGSTAAILPWVSIEVVDLTLNDGAQTVDGRNFSGSLRVQAQGGADTIYGTALGDQLDGGSGNDFIEGGGGADVFQGGTGLDLLHARDGTADSGDCGADEDTLVADRIDAVGGCERIDLPLLLDKTKPKLKLKRATLARQNLRLPISCPKSEVRCAGLLTLAGLGKLDGKQVRVKLGTVAFKLKGGKSKTLTRAVSAQKRQALRGLDEVRLRVKFDVLDASGNRARGSKRVSLKL